MAELDFPRTPEGTLAELWAAVLRLLPQLRRRVRRAVAVKTVETPIAHGLKFAPQMSHATPLADARVWETRIPDDKCVYLAASVDTTANVEFVP